MKFTKLSLATIVAMGLASSAFAVENVKVDGQLKLWYQTSDTTQSANETQAQKADGLFKRDGATGDLVAKLRATGDLTKKVGFGMTMYAMTTAGLENNLVADVASGSATNSATNGTSTNPYWLGEAYFTYKAGNTIAKIGRQELDTPLAYTETWNAAPNTFEAAVLVNKDIPHTTLVAAYVARGNGWDNRNTVAGNALAGTSGAYGDLVNTKTVNADGTFTNYHTLLGDTTGHGAGYDDKGGAYAVGAVFTGIPNLTLHPVYYNVLDTATATWVDATFNAPYGVTVKAAYANVAAAGQTEKFLKSTTIGLSDVTTDAWAAEVSGAVYGVNLAAAYSAVGKGFFPIANTATGFKKTKLYTASILSDGTLAAKPDTASWKLSAATKLAGFDLGASYGQYKVSENNGKADWFSFTDTTGTLVGQKWTTKEWNLSAGTKIDEVNLMAYYLDQKEATKTSAGVTKDVKAVRVIASINF